MDNSKRYRDLKYKIPEQSQAWRIYGKGMENFGDKNGSGKRHPSLIPITEPKDDEILVRSDAVGLCFSDTKIIKLGPDHPRLKGRNMREEPVIPGHEVALTIVKAGKKWRGYIPVISRPEDLNEVEGVAVPVVFPSGWFYAWQEAQTGRESYTVGTADMREIGEVVFTPHSTEHPHGFVFVNFLMWPTSGPIRSLQLPGPVHR